MTFNRTVRDELAKQLRLFKFHSAKSEHYRYLAERRRIQGRFSTAVFYQELSAAQWRAADQHRRNWQHSATPLPRYVQQIGRALRHMPKTIAIVGETSGCEGHYQANPFKDGEHKVGDVITVIPRIVAIPVALANLDKIAKD